MDPRDIFTLTLGAIWLLVALYGCYVTIQLYRYPGTVHRSMPEYIIVDIVLCFVTGPIWTIINHEALKEEKEHVKDKLFSSFIKEVEKDGKRKSYGTRRHWW